MYRSFQAPQAKSPEWERRVVKVTGAQGSAGSDGHKTEEVEPGWWVVKLEICIASSGEPW